MKALVDPKDFRYTGGKKFSLKKTKNSLEDRIYKDKADYREIIWMLREEIDDLQKMMYAHDRYSMLTVFQAMDAAGKDGTIRAVFSGVNPHGVATSSFKRPSSTELEHNFLWRTTLKMPERGRIGVFNRSYYEEVLVCRVHPNIITEFQKLPEEATRDMGGLWGQRYRAIRDFERYAAENGTVILKFFLNVSKEEQCRRFLDRIERPEKNWKFSEADVRERGFWDDYMEAYETCINETAAEHAPWYVIPADDKKAMRLIVASVVLDTLRGLDMHYPEVSEERRRQLGKYAEELSAEEG